MSIHSPDFGGHITITAPAATNLLNGPRTVATLFKNLANSDSQIWYVYDTSNFSQMNLYFDGDLWESFKTWDANFSISAPTWRWLVLTRGSTNPSTHRGHVATLTPSGALSWSHSDLSGTRPNFGNVNRISIGDEFGSGMRGDMAVLTGFNIDMDDSAVEALFVRSSADILAASPVFFTHFPESAGIGSPFADLAGGGVETIRTGTWSASSDPDGYVFSSSRSGKVKRWNGSSWVQHPVKRWNGSTWVTHPIKGYDGSSFVTAK